MAMARMSIIQHPNSGYDFGPVPHCAKIASIESSASAEELSELSLQSQMCVLRDSQSLLKRQNSIAEKTEDTGERQGGFLHHVRTASAYPGVARGTEDTLLDYDSGYEYASTSSFEFHKGDRGGPRPIVGPYLKSAPSKWDDAEKWLVSQPSEVAFKSKSKSGPLHGQGFLNTAKRVIIPNPQDWQYNPHPTKNGYTTSIPNGTETMPLGDGGHSVKLVTTSHPKQNFDISGERTKKMDVVRSGPGGAHNFAFVPVPTPPPKSRSSNSFDCHPVADEPADMKEVDISHERNDDESLIKRTEKPTSDSVVSAAPYVTPAPAVRSVSMRDMGTEMTPIASQEPSRTGTPIRATTPTMRSPVSSCPSTPERASPAPTPIFDTENASDPDGDNTASDLNGKEMQLKTRREVQILAAWASKEEEDEDASKSLKNIDLEEVKKNVLETRAAAWEEAEQAKYLARFKREEAKIQAWENHERAKAEAEMRRIEVKVERTRSHAHEKLLSMLAAARQQAEERRAAAEAKRCEQAAKTAQRADHIRRTGRMPSSFFSCGFCH